LKLQAIFAGLIAAIAIPAAAQETYVLEPAHSQPGFETTHIGMSTQRGAFGKATGTVTLDRAAKKGTVDVTIDTTSIKTFDARLDPTLKGDKYFNVEKYPTITFKSSNVVFDGDRVVAVNGEMTMLGVTKPVNLKVDNFKCGEHPFNKRAMCGADASATIKRSDWGMTAGIPLTPSDEVKLVIPIEAFRQ
jgi:polyisoprenoid-binding protein YceI